MPGAWAGRVRQFARAVGAWFWVEQAEAGLEEQVLHGRAVDLFRAMPRYDRRHAAAVARLLMAGGHREPELIAAALLHDAAKSAGGSGRVRLWHRVAAVVLQATRPALLQRWGQDGRPGSWRYPFYVQVHHAVLGARLAEQAGCTPRTAELIRRHGDREAALADPWLAALQAADDEN